MNQTQRTLNSSLRAAFVASVLVFASLLAPAAAYAITPSATAQSQNCGSSITIANVTTTPVAGQPSIKTYSFRIGLIGIEGYLGGPEAPSGTFTASSGSATRGPFNASPRGASAPVSFNSGQSAINVNVDLRRANGSLACAGTVQVLDPGTGAR